MENVLIFKYGKFTQLFKVILITTLNWSTIKQIYNVVRLYGDIYAAQLYIYMHFRSLPCANFLD